MNRPSEELLHKTLENRATAAEAAHGDRRRVQGKLVAEAVVVGITLKHGHTSGCRYKTTVRRGTWL